MDKPPTPNYPISNLDPETPEKRKTSKSIAIISAISALSISVASVVAFKVYTEGKEPHTDPNAQSTSQPYETETPTDEALPSETASETPVENSPEVVTVDVTKIPESVVEYNLFETLTEDQQAEILEMKNMSVEEFRTLPREDQLKFAYFIYDNNIDVLKYRMDNTVPAQTEIYEGANLTSAEGLQKNEALKYLLLSSLKTKLPEGGFGFDTDTALKASVYMTDGDSMTAQQAIDEDISSWTVSVPPVFIEVSVDDSTMLDNGDTIANLTTSAGVTQNRYRVVDIALINGETRKESVQTLSVGPTDSRYLDDIHVLDKL